MVLQKPRMEFVPINTSRDVLTVSPGGAGYVNCENSGPETGFGYLGPFCELMSNPISTEQYCTIQGVTGMGQN